MLQTRQKQVTTWKIVPGDINGFGIAFSLQNLDNVTNFRNVFDQYRIRAVACQIMPRTNVQTYDTSQDLSFYSPLYWATDLDDAVPPVSLAAILELSSCRSGSAFVPHRVFFKPKPLLPIFTSGTSTGISLGSNSRWIDTRSADVLYNGLKLAMKPGGASTDPSIYIDIVTTFYIQFRNVR